MSVAILDTSAAHLDLLTTYLDTREAAIYADCVGGVSTGALKTATQWHTGVMQTALWSGAMASSLWAKAETYAGAAELVTWEVEWNRAQDGFRQSVLLADTAINRITRCENPLGIEESDLPLYFVDAGTVNRQFFAISDYLLTTWALPAVASADAALDGARQAWLNQRSAEIRAMQTEFDQERRIESFQNRAGAVIRDGCGLSLTAQETWSQYRDGKIDLTSCYIVPASENPACEDRVARLWKSTDHNVLELAALACGGTIEQAAADMVMARQTFCHAMRHHAARKEAEHPTMSDVESLIMDPRHPASTQEARAAYWFLTAALSEQTGEFLVDHAPDNWPLLDSVTVNYSGVGDECDALLHYEVEGSDEGFGLDRMRDLHTALARTSGGLAPDPLCGAYLQAHPYPPGFVVPEEDASDAIDPEATAECFRGTLGEFELSLLSARQSTRATQQAILDMRDNYQMHASTCIQLATVQEKRDAAILKLEEALHDASLLANIVGIAAGAGASGARAAGAGSTGGQVAGGVSAGGGVAGGIASVVFGDRAKALQQKHDRMMRILDGQAEALTCWSNATAAISSVQSHIESVQAGLIQVATAQRIHADLVVTISAEAKQTEGDIERAQSRKLPDMRHDYWLDEEVDLFQREFAWAKRLTYLAMRAVEYETQGMFGLRQQILSATHPDELSAAVRELQREQATRGINGARPERNQLILSLRDDLMNLVDRTPNPDLASSFRGERELLAVDQFAAHLLDPANGVYDDTGEYLGQGVEFEVRPTGPLAYRCAERLWSINAVTVGDLTGLTEPSIPLFVLKQNVFHSQWCAGRGDGSPYQSASNRPSNNLFKGSDSKGSADESGAFAWGFVQGWLNVKRGDFYSGGYANGASAELAGRGLYGRYMLLFPWYGLIDENGDQLAAIEDILLRFDYLSVSNGPEFGGPGSAPDNLGIPSQTVTGFVARSSTVDTNPIPAEVTIALAWDPVDYPGHELTRVLRTTGAEPAGPDDAAALLVYDGLGNAATDTGLGVGSSYSYWAYTRDWDERWHGPTRVNVVAIGKVYGLTCAPGTDGNQLDWSLPIYGPTDAVVRRRMGDAAADSTGGEAVALNSGLDALDTDAADSDLYTYTVFLMDAASGTASIDGASVRCGVVLDEHFEVYPSPTTDIGLWRSSDFYDPDILGDDGGLGLCFVNDNTTATLGWTLWVGTMEQGQASIQYRHPTWGTGTFSLVAYDQAGTTVGTTPLADTSAGWHLATLDINQSLQGSITVSITGDIQDFCIDDLLVGVSR